MCYLFSFWKNIDNQTPHSHTDDRCQINKISFFRQFYSVSREKIKRSKVACLFHVSTHQHSRNIMWTKPRRSRAQHTINRGTYMWIAVPHVVGTKRMNEQMNEDKKVQYPCHTLTTHNTLLLFRLVAFCVHFRERIISRLWLDYDVSSFYCYNFSLLRFLRFSFLLNACASEFLSHFFSAFLCMTNAIERFDRQWKKISILKFQY